MQKPLLTFILMLLTIRSWSNFEQADSTRPDTSKGRFNIGFSFAPDLLFAHVSGKDQALAKSLNYDFLWGSGYTVGLNVFYQLTPGLHLQSGFLYSKKSEYYKDDIYTDSFKTYRYNIVNHFRLFELPIRLNKQWNEKKISFTTGVGLIPQWLMAMNTDIKLNGEYLNPFVYELKGTPRIFLVGFLAAGIRYKYSEDFAIKIECELRYRNKDVPMSMNQYHLFFPGINFALISL